MKNLHDSVLIDNYQIKCEHETDDKEVYYRKTCSMKYNLKKNSDYIDDEEEKNENPPIATWKLVIIIIVVAVYFISCCFFVFFVPNKYCCTDYDEDEMGDKFVCCGWIGVLIFTIGTCFG